MRLFIENIPSVRPFYQLNSQLFAFKNERTAKIFSNQ